MISMTWPQYRRCECGVPTVVRLTPIETEIVSTLLLRRPAPVSIGGLIEAVYPDPDAEPNRPEDVIRRVISFARRKGIPIVTTPHGYTVET